MFDYVISMYRHCNVILIISIKLVCYYKQIKYTVNVEKNKDNIKKINKGKENKNE